MEKKRSGFASAVFAFAMLMAIALTVVGIVVYTRSEPRIYAPLLAGLVSLIVALVAYGVSCQVHGALRQGEQNWQEVSALAIDRMEQFSVMLNLISEQQLISERTKMMAFRDKDRDALYRAIREEMARGEFDAALVLVNDMDNTFGHKQEADQIRAEIARMREGSVRRGVNDTMTQIDRDCSAEKWDEAMQLAQQAAATYPGDEQAAELPEQVRQRKLAIKQQLLERWRDAVARKDTDASVDVLRALDIYVSPAEVAQLKDGALEIFRARIEQLRQQFTTHVHQKKWVEARQVGQNIVEEYPTSKLAQEVRDMLDTLRARAEESATATASV